MDVMSTWIMDTYLEEYNHAEFQYLKTYTCQDNIFPMDAHHVIRSEASDLRRFWVGNGILSCKIPDLCEGPGT